MCRHKDLEHLAITEKIEGKRRRGRQRITFIENLKSWAIGKDSNNNFIRLTENRMTSSKSITIVCSIVIGISWMVSPARGVGHVSDSPSWRRAALLIIDVQKCFLPGGSLAVNEGDYVIPIINWMRESYKHQFSLVALTKDWHCDRHISFVTSHSGHDVFSEVNLRYLENGTLCLGGTITKSNFPEAVTCSPEDPSRTMPQVLWPEHCIQNLTTGSASSRIDGSLDVRAEDVIITKGTKCE
ncbi:nicotinamidase, partial [Plakobranchus ocellatus]